MIVVRTTEGPGESRAANTPGWRGRANFCPVQYRTSGEIGPGESPVYGTMLTTLKYDDAQNS
jgi:hypothetical protein